MHIYHVTAECASLVKVGGLADVVLGLSQQLVKEGHTLEIILPYYRTLNKAGLRNLHLVKENFHDYRIFQAEMEGITITLIDPMYHDYFKRDTVYGLKDDLLRFTSFSLIAHHYLAEKERVDIVHLHDWHTALVAFLNYPQRYPVLYTIHNLSYMGECGLSLFRKLHIDPARIESIREGDSYNLMKAGIVYANHITTVSKTYADEIIYTSLGESLQNTLFTHKDKITGIVNGIDRTFWDPSTDPYLPCHFSLHAMENKKKIKAYVQEKFGISSDNNFLACSITRLVSQKGPELILAAIKEVIALGGSYILLGSACDPMLEAKFLHLKESLSHPHALHLGFVYNEELSHLVYAASDLFVMPSIFEPCGLSQLIAFRYGSIPLVRETGGLKDTVFEGKNGFTFKEAKAESIKEAIRRAFLLWKNEPQKWEMLVKMGMQEDHNWEKRAAEYYSLYESHLHSHK